MVKEILLHAVSASISGTVDRAHRRYGKHRFSHLSDDSILVGIFSVKDPQRLERRPTCCSRMSRVVMLSMCGVRC